MSEGRGERLLAWGDYMVAYRDCKRRNFGWHDSDAQRTFRVFHNMCDKQGYSFQFNDDDVVITHPIHGTEVFKRDEPL